MFYLFLWCIGYGGLWNGTPLTTINENFLENVNATLDGEMDRQVIVACGQGFRYVPLCW